MRLKRYGIPLVSRAPEIRLEVDQVTLDVDTLASARSAADVIALVQGDVLLGFEPRLSDAMSRWLEDSRDALRMNVVRSLEEWLSSSVRAGDWYDVERLARLVLSFRDEHAGAQRALAEARRMQARLKPVASFSGAHSRESGSSDIRRGDGRAVAPAGAASSRLVGRGDILARLLEAVEAPGALPRRVGLGGPPGIGKTRLLDEVCGIARVNGAQIVRLRCALGDQLRPLSLVIDLTRELLRMRGAIGANPESVNVLKRLTGDAAPDESVPDAGARRAAVYAALRDLVSALTDESPLAVVIDDAQWAEPGSWPILAPVFAQDPACWIVAIRAESDEECAQRFATIFPMDGTSWEQVREVHWLDPLAQVDVRALCSARAEPRCVPPEVLEELVIKAAGIPFIGESLVDHWLTTGDASSLPASVTRMVQARLDRLSAAASRVLVTVAVLGLDTVFPALEAVAMLDRAALLTATRELEAAGIARTVDAMMSAHALWTEAALRRAHTSTKRLLHRNAAEWLEFSGRLMERTEPRRHWAIVTHWVDAGEPAKARLELDLAATLLAASGFPVEGALMLERAAELSGVSDAALQYLHRAAELWLLGDGESTVDAVLRIHARYDDVARALEPGCFVAHHDVELLAHIALNRRDPTTTEEALRMQSCVMATDATPLHRLNAAYHLLARYSFVNWERAIVDVIWRSVESVQPGNEDERLLRYLCAAQYFVRFMNQPSLGLSNAVLAHDLIIANRPRIERYYVGCVVLIALSHELLGRVDLVLSAMRDMLAVGQTWKNEVVIGNALNYLVGVLLELGHCKAARDLLPLFGRPRTPDGVVMDSARSVHWAVCTLQEGDAATARAEFGIPLEVAYQSVSNVKRARVLAIYAHIAFLERDDGTARQLLPLLQACFGARTRFMDYPAYVAASLLARYEGDEAAGGFVRQFMEQRVEQWTPRAELLRFLDIPLGGANAIRRVGAV
ncbi:MAG: AAA family ATPase [bacterium]